MTKNDHVHRSTWRLSVDFVDSVSRAVPPPLIQPADLIQGQTDAARQATARRRASRHGAKRRGGLSIYKNRDVDDLIDSTAFAAAAASVDSVYPSDRFTFYKAPPKGRSYTQC